MSAGLPALGLGGVFYLLLIIWMTVRGCVGAKHDAVQWSFIGKMTLMGGLMVAALIGEWLAIRKAVELAGTHIPSITSRALEATSLSSMLLLYSVPFCLLALLLLTLRTLRLATNPRGRCTGRANPNVSRHGRIQG